MGEHDRSARALSLSRLIFQPVAAGAVGAWVTSDNARFVASEGFGARLLREGKDREKSVWKEIIVLSR
jgi:hypothetical protein